MDEPPPPTPVQQGPSKSTVREEQSLNHFKSISTQRKEVEMPPPYVQEEPTSESNFEEEEEEVVLRPPQRAVYQEPKQRMKYQDFIEDDEEEEEEEIQPRYNNNNKQKQVVEEEEEEVMARYENRARTQEPRMKYQELAKEEDDDELNNVYNQAEVEERDDPRDGTLCYNVYISNCLYRCRINGNVTFSSTCQINLFFL